MSAPLAAMRACAFSRNDGAMTYPLMPAANELRYRKKSIVAPVVSSTATCTRSLRHGNRVSRLGSSSLFTNRTSKSAGAASAANCRLENGTAKLALDAPSDSNTNARPPTPVVPEEDFAKASCASLANCHTSMCANRHPTWWSKFSGQLSSRTKDPSSARRAKWSTHGSARIAASVSAAPPFSPRRAETRRLISFSAYRGRASPSGHAAATTAGVRCARAATLSAPNASPRCPTTSTFFSASDERSFAGSAPSRTMA